MAERAVSRAPRIGVSACMWGVDPSRQIFNGRPLLYLEESMAHYLQQLGAIVYMIPSASPNSLALEKSCRYFDGLVLQGGVDVSPISYGESALKDDWQGDRRRDLYEMELIRAFDRQRKPILGICRGLQLLNVCFGGSLYQDIQTFHPEALVHRRADIYEQNFHSVEIEAATRLAEIYPAVKTAKINSVHHQSVKDLAPGFVISARCPADGIVEAIERVPVSPDDPLCFGVQWHPEFQDPKDSSLLDASALLDYFMDALKKYISQTSSIS